MKFEKKSFFPPSLSAVAFMFNLPDSATVKKVVHSLPRVGVGTNFGLPQTRWDFGRDAATICSFVGSRRSLTVSFLAVFLLAHAAPRYVSTPQDAPLSSASLACPNCLRANTGRRSFIYSISVKQIVACEGRQATVTDPLHHVLKLSPNAAVRMCLLSREMVLICDGSQRI